MIPLFKVAMSEAASSSVGKILQSGYVGQGEKVDRFEGLLGEYFDNNNVVTVNSCTAALHLALHMVKGDGGEVLTTPITCMATNWPILTNGLDIRWVEVDSRTINIDPVDMMKKISPRTRAIIAVHWGGYPCDLDEIKKVANHCYEKYGNRPAIIEDCAHCLGSTYKGKMIGNHGNHACFSFQAIKHLTTVDGGLLIPPKESYKRAKLLRWCGLDRESSQDFRCSQNVQEAGFKFHMNDINATIGIENMTLAIKNVIRHQENSKFYHESLERVDGISTFEGDSDRTSSCWLFTIKVNRRDDFKRAMTERGIHTSQVHAPNHTHDCVKQFKCDLPVTEDVASKMICIPNGWWVTDEDREYIIDCIKKGW